MQLDDEQKETESEETNARKENRGFLKWATWGAIAIVSALFVTVWASGYLPGSATSVATTTTPSPRQTVVVSAGPGKTVVAWGNNQALVVRERNTSDRCPGVLPFRWLDEDREDNFNKYGCMLYWKKDEVVGTVILVGTLTSREITAGNDPGGAWTAYSAKAKKGSRAGWQPVICDSRKEDMTKDDCS
jgi:hypothetical protein